MMRNDPPQLSEQGERRKQALKAELLYQMHRHHQHKRRTNRMIGGAAVLGIVAIGLTLWLIPASPTSVPPKTANQPQPSTPLSPHDRPDQPVVTFESIGDDQAVALLEEAGHVGVVAEVDGQWALLVVSSRPNGPVAP